MTIDVQLNTVLPFIRRCDLRKRASEAKPFFFFSQYQIGTRTRASFLLVFFSVHCLRTIIKTMRKQVRQDISSFPMLDAFQKYLDFQFSYDFRFNYINWRRFFHFHLSLYTVAGWAGRGKCLGWDEYRDIDQVNFPLEFSSIFLSGHLISINSIT